MKMKDPSIKTGLSGIVLFGSIFPASIVLAYTMNFTGLIMAINAIIWILSLISLSIVMVWVFGNKYPSDKINIIYRLPVWWIYLSGVVTVGLFWYVSGGLVLMTTLLFISKAVLSVNYISVLEYHDKKYTERYLKRQKLESNIVNFIDDISNLIKDNKLNGGDTGKEKQKPQNNYWST